jgi:hypothetical protein
MKNPASRRGFQSQYSNTLAVLLSATLLATALLLLARLLLATLLLLAWLLLSALLATLLLTPLLLLAGLLVGILILIHRSVLSNVGSKRHSINWRPVGKRQCPNRRIVPVRFPLEWQSYLELRHLPMCSFLQLEDSTMGRYLLLWVIGVPIPILVLIWMFGGLH